MESYKTKKLNPKSTAQQIINLVEAGEKLTVSQLSDRLDVGRGTISVNLSKLRKMGYFYHPVGDSANRRDRVIVNVTTEPAYYISTQEDYNKQINARIGIQFAEMETTYDKLPEVRDSINATLLERGAQIAEQKTWLERIAPKGFKKLLGR